MVPILFLCSLLAVAALSLWLFSPLVNTILFSSETINSTSKQLLENNQGPWEGKWKTNYVRLPVRLPLLQMISKIEYELNRWFQINHQKKSTENFTQHYNSQGILLFYCMILTVPLKMVKSQKDYALIILFVFCNKFSQYVLPKLIFYPQKWQF